MTVQNQTPEVTLLPGEGPSDNEIMAALAMSSTSSAQLCNRLRALFLPLEAMEQQVYEVNAANGWFDDDRTVGDDIALLHTEVSEMFEAYRDQGLADATGHYPPCDPNCGPDEHVEGCHQLTFPPIKPEGFGAECADVLIRLLDTTRRRRVDLRAEYTRKIAYNATRGHKHGGKTI